MNRTHKMLAGVLSAVMLDCGSAAPSDPVASPCAASQGPGRNVIGCGLAPQLAVLGADAEAIYAVDGNRTWFRVERATGQPTRLYHSQALGFYMARATTQLYSTAMFGDKIYLLDGFVQDGHYQGGLMALDTRSPSSPSMVIPVEAQAAVPFALADGYVYFQDRLGHDGAIKPLMRAPLGGGASQLVYDGEAEPFAIHGGYVYFVDVNRAIRRVPVSGGSDSMILPMLPRATTSSQQPITYLDLAVDDGYLYVPFPSTAPGAPHTIQRFAVTGGDSGSIVASLSTQGDVPASPPGSLRIDGDFVYFVSGPSLGRTLARPGGSVEIMYMGATTAPPIFDAGAIYETDQLGGEDAPLEGIIVSIPK